PGGLPGPILGAAIVERPESWWPPRGLRWQTKTGAEIVSAPVIVLLWDRRKPSKSGQCTRSWFDPTLPRGRGAWGYRAVPDRTVSGNDRIVVRHWGSSLDKTCQK